MTNNNENQREKIITPTQAMFQKFKANRLAMFALCTFIVMVVVIIASQLYYNAIGYDFADLSNIANKNLEPSSEYWFGTDRYGRDYFPRVLTGGYISLKVAFFSTAISVTLGILIGSIAGYAGGRVDNFLMRFSEIVMAMPFLAFAYIFSAIYSDKPDEFRIMLIILMIGLLGWTGLARMIRGQILSLKEQEFMTATRAIGLSRRKQITRHLLPNIIAYVIVNATISFASAIMTESTLSFLGLSVSEPVATWGGLLSRASTSTVMKNQWWLWIFPGILLFILVMSINLIGEGLRDAVDPKAKVIKKESLFAKLFGSKLVRKNDGGEKVEH